jgi:tellurite resistance protein TerC
VFIGVKLILTFVHEQVPSVPKISTAGSLVFIALVLIVVVIASWLKVRKDPTVIAHAGRVTATPEDEPKQ